MADDSLSVVSLDGHVLLRIIRHCKDSLPSLVTGSLLGIDEERVLNVTHSFPIPAESEAEGDIDVEDYQLKMLKLLKEINIDNNTVGWYRSAYLGSFLDKDFLETQRNHQEKIPRSCVIIFDPLQTTRGTLVLKAFRLSDRFMDNFRSKNPESVLFSDTPSLSMLEELPIRIRTSNLTRALLFELMEELGSSMESTFDRLDLATGFYLEKNLELLIECVEDLSAEQCKHNNYQRQLQKQAMQQEAFKKKRRAENEARKKQGEPLLPEEDVSDLTSRPIQTPSRLESLLITNQIDSYCEQINRFANQSFSKLFLMGGLQH